MNEYDVIKLLHPIKTTQRAGVDVQKLVKEKFPQPYAKLFLNKFDWGDLDGVLDFLYGERELGFFSVPSKDITEIIVLIESNCKVKK